MEPGDGLTGADPAASKAPRGRFLLRGAPSSPPRWARPAWTFGCTRMCWASHAARRGLTSNCPTPHPLASTPCCTPPGVSRMSRARADSAGVAQGKDGAIAVDDNYQTSVPSIHALGDVTARVQLTPVALGEAMALVDHLFRRRHLQDAAAHGLRLHSHCRVHPSDIRTVGDTDRSRDARRSPA